MHPVVRRLTLPLLALTVAAACLGPGEADQINIPEGSVIYKIAPQLLVYEFSDSSGGSDAHLTWLPSMGYIGYNCFGFLPTTPTDTTGTFAFDWAGPNTGMLERRLNGVTDTIPGYFIDNLVPGKGGTYVVDSSGKLTLTWNANSNRNRYFEPSAQLRLYGDTVESIADIRANADSLRNQWRVYWTYSQGCP